MGRQMVLGSMLMALGQGGIFLVVGSTICLGLHLLESTPAESNRNSDDWLLPARDES